jgi:hypothetical protein
MFAECSWLHIHFHSRYYLNIYSFNSFCVIVVISTVVVLPKCLHYVITHLSVSWQRMHFCNGWLVFPPQIYLSIRSEIASTLQDGFWRILVGLLTNSVKQSPIEKLTVTQLVVKLPTFNGSRRFITVFTRAPPRPCVTFRDKLLFFLRWGVVCPSPNLQVGGLPNVSCPILFNIFTATIIDNIHIPLP